MRQRDTPGTVVDVTTTIPACACQQGPLRLAARSKRSVDVCFKVVREVLGGAPRNLRWMFTPTGKEECLKDYGGQGAGGTENL